MNKNSSRRFHAAHDAFGRSKPGRGEAPANIGSRARVKKSAKVGASGMDIARRLGHDVRPNHTPA